MKITLRLLLSLTLLATLAVGCAKKPAAVVTTPTDTSAISSAPAGDSTGYGDSSLASGGVGDRPASSYDALLGGDIAGLNRIYFGFDQFTLSDEARATLANNADYLKANPGLNIRIEGHCDERGSDEYNLALGERRANAAKSYLVSLGIAPHRLNIISFGEEMPLAVGSDESAWAQNRRSEFKASR